MDTTSSFQRWSQSLGAVPEEFVGPTVCAGCHVVQAATQKQTAMAHAARPAESDILRAHPQLSFELGKYSYQIRREGGQVLYSVSDGMDTISLLLLTAFGLGSIGQTYVFEHHGSLYESRVSYFTTLKGLDITIGHPRDIPASIEEALD
jgi:hypothetical protein